jgi:hypothetical protein
LNLHLGSSSIILPGSFLGNLNEDRRLRSRIINPSNEVSNEVTYNCYLAQFEPKKVEEALQDDS